MLPDPYAAVIFFEHQERLREAARDRLAASAQRSSPSLLARLSTARYVAVSRLSSLLLRSRGVRQEPLTPAVAPDQPQATPA